MRTNIEIDDDLMNEALGAGGLKTKRATVEEGLRLLIRRRKALDLLALAGKVEFFEGYDPRDDADSTPPW